MCATIIYIPDVELRRIIHEIKANPDTLRIPNLGSVKEDKYPGAILPILIPSERTLKIQEMQWGYPVSWQKQPVFNARFDTALGKNPDKDPAYPAMGSLTHNSQFLAKIGAYVHLW